jgi:hypothetical protein
MKKLMTLMLGLALVCAYVTPTFAQDTTQKKGKKGGKGKKKKGDPSKKG